MEVTYTLTPADFAAFRRFHARHGAKWRPVNQFLGVVLMMLWAVQLLICAHILSVWRSLLPLGLRAWGFLPPSAQQMLLGFVLFTLFIAYRFWGQKLLLARQGHSAAVLSQPKHLRISPEGVEVATVQEQVQRPWNEIPHVRSDLDYLYLYVTSATALVVPRRAFPTLEQSQAFEAQARAFKADPFLSTSQAANTDAESAVWPPPPVFSTSQEPPVPLTPELEDVPDTVHVSYVTNQADLIRAQWFFALCRPQALLGTFLPYVLLAGLWTFAHLPPLAAVAWAIIVAAIGTLLTLLWIIQKAAKRRFVQYAGGKPSQTIARPDLLCDISPEVKLTYYWPEIAAIHTQGRAVYVQAKSRGGVFIPRSAFADSRAAGVFARQLREWWQAGKDTQPSPAALPPNLSQTNR